MSSLCSRVSPRVFLALDLDECAENSHNCPATSVCNNTVGSFICTCPGLLLEWDGTNCSGKYKSHVKRLRAIKR